MIPAMFDPALSWTTLPVDDDVRRLLAAQLRFCEAPPAIDDLHQLLVELSQDLVGADGAVLEHVEDDFLVYGAGSGLLAGTTGLRIKREGSLSGLAIATGEPQLSSDVFADERTDHDTCRRLGVGSIIVQPIRRGHDNAAVVKVAAREPNSLAARQCQVLQHLIQLAAIRLEHVAALHDRTASDRLLADVSEASRAILIAEDPAAELCAWAARLANAPYTVYVEPEPDGTLRAIAQHGPSVEAFALGPDKRSLLRLALETRSLQLAPDFRTHGDSSPELVAAVIAAGLSEFESGAAIPVVSADRAIGALGLVLRDRLTAARAAILGLVRILAAEAGVAIERNELQHRLEQQARYDDLTALPNRRVWNERLTLELARAARKGTSLCLVILDLDHFKDYNDSRGHHAGDVLLRAVADAWAQHVRETDLLARLGGEEFVLMLPDTAVDSARAITQRLLGALPVGITASAGIACWGSEVADVLYQRADAALYAAKDAGRNQLVIAPANGDS